MEIEIQDASISNLDALYEIEKQSFKEEAFSKQQIAYLLTDYNAISLIACAGGELAGFVIGRFDLIRNQTVGHIMTIDVASFYRRKGIGQKLLLEIEALFKQRGVKECRLEVRESNLAAISLYEKLGYKKIAKLEKYYGESHGLYLKKMLL